MNSYYMSLDRFRKRIIKKWVKNSFNYHNGHINILSYSYRTLMFWASVRGKKISNKNRVETTIKMF